MKRLCHKILKCMFFYLPDCLKRFNKLSICYSLNFLQIRMLESVKEKNGYALGL